VFVVKNIKIKLNQLYLKSLIKMLINKSKIACLLTQVPYRNMGVATAALVK
jgi:hypothetical protein